MNWGINHTLDLSPMGLGLRASVVRVRPQVPICPKTICIYTKNYVHDLRNLHIFQVWVQLFLDLCDLVNVLDAYVAPVIMARQGGELLHTRSFMQEPARLWRFHIEFEGTISEGSEANFEGDVAPNVACFFIKLFAEFHHVDSQRTKGLTHLRVGLCHSCQHSQVHSC